LFSAQSALFTFAAVNKLLEIRYIRNLLVTSIMNIIKMFLKFKVQGGGRLDEKRTKE